jgi:outer membrane protein insertion porin family
MKKNIKRLAARILVSVSTMTLALHAWAVDPFNIRDIRIEGLQRIEPGTVFASLPVRVGDGYTDDKGTAAIRALFALGLFKDVRLEVAGDVLVVIVEERPTVADVNLVGTSEFDKDTLRKSLRDIGLTEGRPYDQALADSAEQELKRQYISRSLYGAEVVTTVTPIERNRVNLTLTITEGEPAKIRDIRIVGNKAFSQSTLKGLFDLDTGGFFSWYTKSNRYSRVKLNADLESLRSYYSQRGYLEFSIDSTQVAISTDKQDLTVTINVTEGERFVVSGIKLEGNYLGRDDEFKSMIAVRAGEPYNGERVAETTKAFTEYFGNFGYAFAQVEARPEIDRATNRVNLVIVSEPSRRAYVRRINVSGNTRTRDEVIRREFRQFESSWYDGDRIRRSRDRVDRLGFFKEVNIDTANIPGAPDQVDLNINVVEKPTGSISLSAGFSSADKLGLGFGIRQENAFGSGKYLAAEFNTSDYNQTLVLSSVDPYFTQDGVSRSFDIFHRTTRPYQNQVGTYEIVSSGAGLRFGVPFTELDTVAFGVNVERTQINSGTYLPLAFETYITQYGATTTLVPLTLSWSRDSRDSALVPTTGRLQRASSEWGAIGDAQYVRGTYQFQQYFPLTKQYTYALNSEIGLGKGLGGRDLPIFKNFFGGGLGSVRGFQQGSLGPRGTDDAIIGGAKRIVLNNELIVPMPGAGNDRTLRLYGFLDVGNVYAESARIDLADLRASVGLGLSWISPMGPLRMGFANAVRKQSTDRMQKIQFQIGTSF